MLAAIRFLDANIMIDIPYDYAFAAPLEIAMGLNDLLFRIEEFNCA